MIHKIIFLLIAGLFFFTPCLISQKDAGAGWCGLHGNYTGASCPGCNSSVPGPPMPPPVYIKSEEEKRFEINREKYLDIIKNIKSLHISHITSMFKTDYLKEKKITNIDDLFNASMPRSTPEIDQRISRIYFTAAVWRHYLGSVYKNNQSKKAYYNNEIARTIKGNEILKQKIKYCKERIIIEKDRYNKFSQKKKIEDLAINSIDQKTIYFREKISGTQKYIADLMLPLLPVEHKKDFEDFQKKIPAFGSGFMPNTFYGSNPIGNVSTDALGVNFTKPYNPISAIPTDLSWVTLKVNMPPMTVEKKMQIVNDLVSAIAEFEFIVGPTFKETEPLKEKTKLAEVEKENNLLWGELLSQKEPVESAYILAEKYERGYKAVVDVSSKYVSNLLNGFIESIVWEYLKEEVVIPAVDEFLKENKLYKGMKMAEAIDRIRKNPQELIAGVSRLKNLNTLIEVEEKVLDGVLNFQSYADKAAELLANGNPSQIQDLSVELFKDLDNRGTEIIQTVSNSVETTSGKIFKKLMEKRPD